MSMNPIQVQQYLKGIDYPISKQGLIKYANDNGAPKEVLDTLEQISGKEYNGPTDLTHEIAMANK